MTPEMLNFHQVISELQVAEDNMLDNHKQTIEAMQIVYHKSVELLQTTEEVDYDQEGNNLWFYGEFIDSKTLFLF